MREEKHTVGSIKNIFRNDENIFCQDINIKKMTGFLDEKYTQYI